VIGVVAGLVLGYNTMYWSRQDTQLWISHLENRIEDIDYYLTKTLEWCTYNEVESNDKVFTCCAMIVIWVSHMRGEPISRRELLEYLKVADWYTAEDAEYSLDPVLLELDFEQVLDNVLQKFED
jgi:hypothetical protein